MLHASRIWLLAGLLAQGFKLQRAFTRMVRGGSGAPPGDQGQVMLVAGPELG